ncbi:UPF0524 protein C3orf70 homolog A-like [Diretmus argenteus]
MTSSGKRDEAQASARSCAGRPDFLPCDGGRWSACTTHSHGKCFNLHWCCHLGWCHCKYVYQPMTSVLNLPSTLVPSSPSEHSPSFSLSISLAERFLGSASALVAPATPNLCTIAELFAEDYTVKRIHGKMCYVQRLPLTPPPKTPATLAMPPSLLSSPEPHRPTPIHQSHLSHLSHQSHLSQQPQMISHIPSLTGKPNPPTPDQRPVGQKLQPCSSPSSSEDSGINAVGGVYTESYDEEEEEEQEEEEESNSDMGWRRGSYSEQEDVSLLDPSRSLVEILEKIETTV